MPPTVNNDPNFIAPQTNPFGLTNVGIYAAPTFADIDGDGDLDAFVGNGIGQTVFYRNTGTAAAPTFTQEATNFFGLTTVGISAAPTFADIDGDGDLDAFVGEYFGNTLFYRNTGTAAAPTFTLEAYNPFGLTDVGLYATPTLADIDGDGDLDAFVGDYSGNTLFYRNTGTATAPTFTQEATNFGLTDVGYVAAPTFADIDGDGDLDAFVGDYSGNTLFYRNTGTATAPTFTQEATNPFGLTDVGNFAAPTLADIDNDGDLDAFVGNSDGNTLFFKNNNAPTGSPTATLGNTAEDTAITINAADLLAGFSDVDAGDTLSVANLTADNGTLVDNGDGTYTFTPTADFNGTVTLSYGVTDGTDTLAGQTQTFSVTPVNTPTGDPNFITPITNPFGLTNLGSSAKPTLADIDGDGDLDAFVGNQDGNTLFYRNTGTATAPSFTQEATNPFGLTNVGSYAAPTFADIDGDGDLDAFVGNYSGNTLFYRNTGTAAAPSFTLEATNPFGLTDVGLSAAPTFADIDGDGDLDAFVGNRDGNTLFYRNTGTAATPSFTQEATNAFGLTNVGSYAAPTLADIDGDGDLDAFVGETYGNTQFYRNTGTAAAPSFTLEATNPFGLTDVGYSATPTFADIDGDGDLDAFVGDFYGNTQFFENVPTTTPVNNAPTGSPTATLGNTAEDTAITINAADLLAGFSDVDAGDTLSVANLTADNGTLVDNLDGTYTFTPTADFNGTVTLDYGVTDGTDTLTGQTQTFSVTAVNDAPIKTVPNFITPITNPFGLTNVGYISAPTFADIDNDGDLDAFVGNAFGNTLFFRNTGTASAPTFTSETTNFGLTDVGYFTKPTFADIDGDGDLDAFVGNIVDGDVNTQEDGEILFFRNTGTASAPTFTQEATNPFGLTNVGYFPAPTFADIDNDGDLDAFVGSKVDVGVDGNTQVEGEILFFRNTGTASAPTFTQEATNPFGLTGADPTFADIDNDGDLDAFVGNKDGDTLFFRNTGTASAPTFTQEATNPFGLTNVVYLSAPTFADIDNDGDLDAFVGNVSGETLFFENQRTATTAEDTAIIINAADLLADFSDVEGDTLSVTGLTTDNGTLVDNGDGTYTFTPSADFNGTVTLTYGVSDGTDTLSGQTLRVDVTPVNDAPVGSPTATLGNTAEDTAIIINAADLLTGFSDVDGDILSVTGLTADNGGLVDNGDGTYTFTPTADFNGVVTLSYGVTDGTDTLTGQTQTFSVTAVNDAPVGSPTATLSNTAEDTAITINAADLLAGFSDVDGDTLSVVGLTANNGALVNNNNGTYTFTPTANFNGTVTLSYGVTDGTDTLSGQTQTFSVTPVNDAPVGSPTATLGNTAEDTAITITAADLLAGFSDVDGGNTLSVVNLTANNGALVNNNNGTYTFTPTANFNGAVNLTYGVSDGTATLAGQTRSFSVTPVNDAPTGSPTATLSNTAEDTAITITAANLLAGFSDVDAGNTLSVVNLTATNGALVNNNNGTYTFTPTADFNGTVTLSYGVSDGTDTLSGQTQTFSVTAVNDAPVGSPTATLGNTAEDTAINITAANLLAGFSDVDGDTLSVVNLTANNGALVNNNNGTYTFTPTLNFNGAVNLTYGVSDGTATLAGQTRSFSVTPVNDIATITGTATAVVTEDAATILTATGSLTVNDVDTNENIFNTSVTSSGNLGSLSITQNGAYSYSVANSAVQYLGAGQTKTETFTVKSIDGTASKNIVVTINGVNDAPTGSPTATLSNTAEDTAITITAANLLAGFSDVDAGNTLSVVNLTANNGALANNNNGTYTFTPTLNFNGAVNLTYGVSDGTVTLAGQTRSFSVTPVNDAPVGVNDSAVTALNTAVTIQASTLLANDTDVDSTSLKITGVSGVTHGTAVLNNNGTASNTADDYIVFTPTCEFSGNASFNYTLSDGSLTGTAAVTVAVGADIDGTNQADNLVGTNGNDNIEGGNGNDTIYGGAGNDTIEGGNGNDLLYGDGFMNGGAGNDIIEGGNGNDTLYGGAGIDHLYGDNGDDILYGGQGSDFLTGDNGKDTFAFAAGEGTDTINDFVKGQDKIGLYSGLSFGQLSFSGSNILVTSTNEILATLTGINTTTLTAANFATL